jgi:two-component system sensor histidine kinase CpxA
MAIRSVLATILASVVVLLVLVATVANVATWLFGIPPDDPRNVGFLVRAAAAAVVVFALCLWLARHITLPIRRIGVASQQLATGELSTRIADAFPRRRDELGRLGREFDAMAAQIEALVTSQRRLLRDVSHELRSPLARLSIAAGLARREASPSAHAHLDRVEEEAERLNRLIGQLLALARLDAVVEPSHQTVFDLSEVIDEIAADGDFEARATGRAVRIVATERCLICGVPELMRSAIENVVRNGIRHTPRGSHVDIALRISSDVGGRHGVISVRDHGDGVPAEAVARLFEPFYRIPGHSNTEGAGLGLAIAHRAVQLHAGAMSTMNSTEGGLVITISVPLVSDDMLSLPKTLAGRQE